MLGNPDGIASFFIHNPFSKGEIHTTAHLSLSLEAAFQCHGSETHNSGLHNFEPLNHSSSQQPWFLVCWVQGGGLVTGPGISLMIGGIGKDLSLPKSCCQSRPWKARQTNLWLMIPFPCSFLQFQAQNNNRNLSIYIMLWNAQGPS